LVYENTWPVIFHASAQTMPCSSHSTRHQFGHRDRRVRVVQVYRHLVGEVGERCRAPRGWRPMMSCAEAATKEVLLAAGAGSRPAGVLSFGYSTQEMFLVLVS